MAQSRRGYSSTRERELRTVLFAFTLGLVTLLILALAAYVATSPPALGPAQATVTGTFSSQDSADYSQRSLPRVAPQVKQAPRS
jgi:hypothetical protein